MKFVTTLRKISEEEFKEEEHPRDTGGKFTSKGGGVSRKTKVSKDKKIDNADRIENVKDDYYIKRMLKAGVQPNEMDLQLAELERKREELGKIKTKRTFKVDLGVGHEETEIRGTPEYEKAWKEVDELRDKVSKKEEDEYRKSYGWKEGDPFRWTPYNDDPDAGDTSGDYGPDYTYKHLTKEESDVIMRRWWNDSMNRKERENKYDYIHGSYINYLNEDEKTPEDLREDLGEDQSIPSDYFFFIDKKTNKQFRGFGMTEEEIKKRAKHGIGSYHEDNRYVGRPDRDVIVYDRPLDYSKFHSKRVSAYNFGKKGSRTDKLWDDLDSSEQSGIKSDYKFDGEFYIGWQEEQEKLFYDWKSKHDNKDGDKVSGKHNELYSEYPELSKQEIVLDKSDFEKMDKKYPKWREDLDSHLYEDWQKEDKKKELMRKRGMQTYFQQDPIERQKYVGVLFDGLSAYDKDMLAGDAFDYEAPNDPTEDDELKWKDLSDQEQSDVVREVENDADEEIPRYEIEEIFQKSLPKKDIGFDYDRGIPKPQTTTILKSWANRMENISYEKGAKMEGKDIIIPQYPKSKQRTVKEHEKQVKQLNSKLKEKNQKNMSDKEKWNWQQETLLEDVEEFRDYVRKNEPNLNLDLTFYKMRWDKDDWTQGDPPTTEKEWRKHFIEDSLRVGDKMVYNKVRQLRGLVSLLDQNPKLDKKYQHILDKTDKLNHDNYDLFIKTPEFYRGTSTEELDHYLNHGNTGKMWDWSEKTYPFTALTLDKSSAQSPSEQRIDWKEEDGKLSGGKVVITYEGDSVREKAVPVQYNTQSSINHSGTDASERIGFPYNMEAYTEREVRMNQNSEVPKIKEINFGVNIGKYKDKKKLTTKQKFMLIEKYLPLVGGDKSKIKFYKFVEHALESGYEVYAVEEFVEDEHPRDEDGKFADKGTGSVGKKDTDISRSLSTRMGRGTMDLGSQVVIKQYNKENPDSQVEIPDVLLSLWQPFEDYDPEEELERFEYNLTRWKTWLDQNPQVKKVFDDMQVEVDEYNKILDDKFENAKTFYSGMGIGDFSDIQANQEMEESENYSFKSFSMNDEDIGFNWGVVVEYDSDFIKKSGGKKVEYTTDILPTMSIHTNFDFIDDGGGKGESIENADSKVNSLFADEQEIRLSNDDASIAKFDEKSIKSVTFDFGKLTIDKFMSRFFEEEDEVGEKGKKVMDSFKKHNGSLLWVERNWNAVVDALRESDEHFGSSWLKNTEYKFKYKPQGIIHKDIKESFKEEDHPRDDDGKFTDKGGSNARVERQKSILQQEIDYLKKSIKEESKKYRPFERVSDEDRAIRYQNKSVGDKIKELEEELNSTDTIGLPYIPLKPNTHEIETIDNGMYLANSDSEPEYESEREAMKSWSGMKLGLHPLEGFKKGNSTIKVSIDIKEKSDSGINREVAEKQINLARIMWNSLSDEERDSIHNLTIEKRPSIKTIKNEKGEDVLDPKSFHEASVVGSWAFNTNELTIRIDPSLKPEMIKGTFIHEVGHSMYHKIKDKHPERIKKWKEMVEKIPPTTKYGKYNRSNWKDSEKMVKELDARNWEWKEVVARDSDGNPIRMGKWNEEVKMIKEPIPKEDVEKLRSNALSNIAFYKDLYFNEIHSEVHMYMMGQQKRGHMKKTGKATKGITKFVEAYRLLHDLPKMEEPLVVGEAEEDSPVMGVEDITEPIGEVVIYLDENFERVLDEDEGEYEFVIELNDDMTIKRYSIRSMWEETATEEFREEDHPREEDGKFTDKDGGGSNKKGLVKSIRDITYNMMIKERQRKLENAMTLKDPDKKLAKVYKKEIEKIEKLRDSNEYRLQGLHSVEFTSTKKNTHTKNKDGFKTNKTEIRIGDTVRVAKYDGQPHPMVQARMDLIVEAIRNVWNALPDEYRDGIHILQIHNVRGLSGTTLGKFSSNRKGTVKTLTMRIRQGDSKNIDTLIHTLLHEVAHSIWHNKFQYDEEKVNKFRDGINKLIEKYGAITDYVQNDHVDMERINEIYWDHRGKHGDKYAYASAFLDSEDMSGEEATRYVAYQKKQIETIVANETHSEAFGFLLGGIDKWGPSKKLRENPEMVQEYFKLVKELHDD